MESNYNSGGSGRTKQLERIKRTLQDKYVRSVGIVAGQLDLPAEKGVTYTLYANTTSGFCCTIDLDLLAIDQISYSGDYNEFMHCFDGVHAFIKECAKLLVEYVVLLEKEEEDSNEKDT